MNALVLGSSAGLGRSLATELAKAGHNLLLIASDERDLAAQAADLQLRYGIKTDYLACKIGGGESSLPQIEKKCISLGSVELLFFPIGAARDDDDGGLDELGGLSLFAINFWSVVSLVTLLKPQFEKRGRGNIVGFGSIASFRGRRRNIVYSAAKRALLSYFESLRHLFSDTQVVVQFYQIGYLDTQQTLGKKLLFPKSDPDAVARLVVGKLDGDFGVKYIPGFWRYVGWMLKLMPWPIFKGLKF